MMAHAVKCPCGSKSCTDWHVQPMAAMQGVHFTQHQAEAVAELLNELADYEPSETEQGLIPIPDGYKEN